LTRGTGGGRNSNNGGGNGSPGLSGALLLGIIGIGLVIWLLTGLYVVQPGEKGVLLRFGAYTHTSGPGWHWRLPYPIDSVFKVDTQKVRSASNRAVMLTKHENYVDVEVAVQYRVSNAMHYLFRVRGPDATVLQVLRSSVREVVGNSSMNQVIQEGVAVKRLKNETGKKVNLKKHKKKKQHKKSPLSGMNKKVVHQIKKHVHQQPQITNRSRATLHSNIRKLMQYRLNKYETGIDIVAVNVKYAQPPEQVQHAFEEAIKAREQKVSKKNKARAYARSLVARAKGEKAQRVAKAKAYKQRKVQRAKGDAARFAKLDKQYQKAPAVTHERLYLQTMGTVLGNSHMILNSGGQSSMNYLPLKQILSSETAGEKNRQAAKEANKDEFGSNGGSSNGNSKSQSKSQSKSHSQTHSQSNSQSQSGSNSSSGSSESASQLMNNNLRNRNRNR